MQREKKRDTEREIVRFPLGASSIPFGVEDRVKWFSMKQTVRIQTYVFSDNSFYKVRKRSV
jgi:hypothetical protein